MLKLATSTVMWIGRTTVFVVGLAVIARDVTKRIRDQPAPPQVEAPWLIFQNNCAATDRKERSTEAGTGG